MTPTEPDAAMTFLALGDSYTIGENVEAAERWPVQLAAALRAEGIPLADPAIIARTGWTTADLLAAIEAQYAGEEYDLVALLIGVNNQYQGLSIDQYRSEFRELLRIAVSAAGGHSKRVIVLSIPDWGFTPFAQPYDQASITEQIDAFNAVALEESEAAGVRVFDITPTTRPAVFDAELFADDGLHPSGKMYALWVNLVLAEIRELLTK